MRLTTKSVYGLRALIEIALNDGGEPITLSTISSIHNLPLKYLEQLLSLLRKKGIIKSIRGTNGGYFLAKKPANISMKDVIFALEGEIEIVPCVNDQDCTESCSNSQCLARPVWDELHNNIINTLANKSLLDVLERK